MELLSLELRKLGLKENEVAVYLAGLELGPTSVLAIAQKTKISRPTVYVILETLKQRGFFLETKEGKKKYFLAQSPDSLLGVLKIQKRALEEKEREFVRIISALKSKYSPQEAGGMKAYKGNEGLKVVEEELTFTSSAKILLLSSEVNLKQIKKRKRIYQKIKKRLGKIDVKEICPKRIQEKTTWLERKTANLSGLDGTLILFDKALFLSSKTKQALLIENKTIIDLLKSLFLLLWRRNEARPRSGNLKRKCPLTS